MSWPWQFVDLDDAQKIARRHALDRYALVAQLSALAPVIAFLLYRATKWAIAKATGLSRGSYSALPGSPVAKQRRSTSIGSWTARWRKLAWWLSDDIVILGWNWGPRDQMIGGVIWGLWLCALSVKDTGNDYLHLTKRLGIVGVSQFPVQYLLSLKNLNPFAPIFNSSHEEINRWHRTLGRVIYVLLSLHAFLYFNFYWQNNLLGQKITSLVPLLGFTAAFAMHLLSGTALSVVRQYSYRVFFITHLIVALALPPIIYFHAHHSSFYVWEALVVFIADIASRRIGTVVADTKVELIPGTDLLKLTGSIPSDKIDKFAKNPGTHIYLSVPPASRPDRNPIAAAHLVFECTFNPFSVAAVDETSGSLTLVARQHSGPMTTAFSHFASNVDGEAKVKLAFDGPYGCAKRFPNFASPEFDRILLVAGGVGATFTLPLYRWILSENPSARVQMVWAVREAGEATWPTSGSGKGIVDDDNIQLFLTGDILAGENVGDSSRVSVDEVELRTLSGQQQSRRSTTRPDLQNIVDSVFKQGLEERIAVLVCGPHTMARELRTHVGAWVDKGRYVWWHNESFEW
ncbi:ferric reductase like transmembrane component [Xylariaceae sp. FL1019]|nr:ferric reductase like transmembrane component [Xylariaceae sp. FL1019]